MSYPQHPDTVIVKNSYYPNGLNELDIWNYYQKNKKLILEQSYNRDLIFFIKTDKEILVKRKGKTTNFIRLNNSNYDEIITGRTLSIHSTMNKNEDFGIIDIDTNDFNKAKEAVIECYDIINKINIFNDLQIRFTGKTSFHIICKLNKKMNIDSIRLLLLKILKNSIINDKYSIGKSRLSPNTPNIDLFRNSYRGGYILLNSLSIIGLKCMIVKYDEIKNFNKEKGIIK